MGKVVLIGASTVDFIAKAKTSFILREKNVGEINLSFGGVMRNIAYSLALLNNKCYFLTVIGEDLYGKNNLEILKKENIEVYYPKTDLKSAIYLCINDSNNDMVCGLTDNSIFTLLNYDLISQNIDVLKNSDYLVIDTNLNEESLNKVFSNIKNKKILVEGISKEKIKRIKPYLKDIYLLKCNNFEVLSLLDINEEKEIDEAILDKFLALGINNLVISQGDKDILYLDNKIKKREKVERVDNYINTTGCGDALFAGIIDSLINNQGLENGVKIGKELAKLTLFSNEAVNIKIKNYKGENKNG